MTKENLRDRFRELGLFPFQADFAVRVLTEESPSLLVLQGPVGSGTTHTIFHAVGEGVDLGTFTRVLCLTAGTGMSYAMREKLEESAKGFPVECVDRKVLREFEAVAQGDANVWPERGVFIATLDFAKRPEVASLFTDAEWDVVVFDEAHRITTASARQDFVSTLISKGVSRVVCAYHTSTENLDDVLSQLDTSRTISKTVWKRHELQNWEGDLFTHKSVEWDTVRYHMNEREAAFYETLEETAKAVDRLVRGNSLVEQSLMNRAMSCLYSVEQALMGQRSRLQHRRNELAHGVGIRRQQGTLFDTEDDDVQRELFDESPDKVAEFMNGYENVNNLLNDTLKQYEDLETDSKSEAAINVLRQLPNLNTCVLSQYEATVSYLHTAFAEEESMHLITLTGRISSDEIESRLSHYRSHGGLLLATDAGLRGFEFPDIDVVLHYDLPMSPERLQFRIGRFNRIGQQGVVKMIGLVEENAITAKLWDKMLSIAADLGP